MNPTRGAAALAIALAAAAPGTRAAGADSMPLGPRLVHYRLRCHAPGVCRIDCYQNGVNVVSRLGLGTGDHVTIAVSTGIADEFTPRWIEIRGPASRDVETVLLGRGAVCDLQSLSIESSDGAR